MADSESANRTKLGGQKLRLLDRVAEDETLTETDLRILIKFVGWTGLNGRFSKSVAYIAGALHVDRSTVQRSIARLCKYIERIGRHNGTGNAANEYRMCFTPQKAVKSIAREAQRSQRDKKRATRKHAGGRTDAAPGAAPTPPQGPRGCDTFLPYSFPSSSLNGSGASRPPNGGSDQRVGLSDGRNVGDVLSKSFPRTTTELHSGNGDGNGVNGETEKSKNTERLLEAQMAFMKKSGCGADALRKIEVGERISFKPVEDQITFWQERAVR